MKTLIIYGSKYGFTETLAKKLAGKVKGEVKLVEAKKADKLKLVEYNQVVIGTPIYMGNIYKDVKNFCQKHKDEILASNYRFFVVGLGGPIESMKNFDTSMDGELIEHAIENAYFGGAIFLDKMNFLERAMMKKFGQSGTLYEGINEDEIEAFASSLNGDGQ
jgi:menaquinone-dependent protoporphyrinogen oxidase